MVTSKAYNQGVTNHLVVPMTFDVTINKDGEATSRSPLLPPSPSSAPPFPAASPDVTDKAVHVTDKTIRAGRGYYLLSGDGEHVLSASRRKSDRKSAVDFNKVGGFRLDFNEVRLWKQRGPSAIFRLSGQPGAYRLHNHCHHNNMLYFLGPDHQLDWVVWDGAVPTDGDWELMELLWLKDGGDSGDDCTRFKIKCYQDKYVKWAVSGFTATNDCNEATEFILHEL